MSRVFTPFTFNTADFSAGGKYDPTAANFPHVKHFWKCNEAPGTNVTLVDSFGGANLLIPGNTTQTQPNHLITPAASVAAPLLNPVSGGNGAVVVAVAYAQGGNNNVLNLGATGDTLIGANKIIRACVERSPTGNQNAAYWNGTNSFISSTGTGFLDQIVAIASRFKPGDTNGAGWALHKTGSGPTYTQDATTTKSSTFGNLSTITSLDLSLNVFIQLTEMYMFYMAVFPADKMPTIDECAQAAAWHLGVYLSPTGVKAIYPGFKR